MTEKEAAREVAPIQGGELAEVDPQVAVIVGREERRQQEKIILIASESKAPTAVRAALSSVFTNVYAEGYPSLRLARAEAAELANVEEHLAFHRRYGDRRYYKGTEMVDLLEALAQRRAAKLFANERVAADEIFVNVQPLSGAAANNAVYQAFLRPGDTLLGLALSNGGHLTHGSPHNRSGKLYHAVSYSVDPASGRLDYEQIRRLTMEHRPRVIVAGASAYPWDIDWATLRLIADESPGTLLLADIAHPAGLVVSGLFPNPVGFADAVTFTTHKTMCGPRGAVIMTTDESLAQQIDRSVFPGEQGGPHVNNIAAMAVAFQIAAGEQFKQLQRQVVANAQALGKAFQDRGVALAFGGTSTHLLLVDLNALPKRNEDTLKGDVASRVLDFAGIVCNKNTIPGDELAAQASGLRFGTVWTTQLGFREGEMVEIADIVHRTITNILPYHYTGSSGDLGRGKLPFEELSTARRRVARLLDQFGSASMQASQPPPCVLHVGGARARIFLQEACAGPVLALQPGDAMSTQALDKEGRVLANLTVTRIDNDAEGYERFVLKADPAEMRTLSEWLEALSDGYVLIERDELYAKVEGPAVIAASAGGLRDSAIARTIAPQLDTSKPYFVGERALQAAGKHGPPKPDFALPSYAGPDRRSALYDEHVRLNPGSGLVPFAGWLMPIWYTSIREEHRAVRETAALFDVSHMGVLEIAGAGAERFLDLVTANYVPALQQGQSHYSFILDPAGTVIDDILLYRRGSDKFMLVCNAVNAERVEAWLRAANSRDYAIDSARPCITVDATVEIRNLKDPQLGDEGRVDLALQGPRSPVVLRKLIGEQVLSRDVARLGKGEFVEGRIGAHRVLISRTGYTGEELGFELFISLGSAQGIWRDLLAAGAELGLKPAGLGARDSARAEAGFPLYGHELGGPFGISPPGAGYGSFVKLHKPFFIGRRELIRQERSRTREAARFRLKAKSARVLRQGDPLVDQRGECIGHVTSSVVVDGRQVGLCYVVKGYTSPGTAVWAFPMSRVHGQAAVSKTLQVGDTAPLPEEAIILKRFGLPPSS